MKGLDCVWVIDRLYSFHLYLPPFFSFYFPSPSLFLFSPNLSLSPCIFSSCSLAPEDVPSPTLTATTTGFVIIRWSEPGQPNGVIRHYTLYKALLNSPFSLLTTVDSNASFYYEDHSVSPYTVYQYYIEASNDAGSTPGAPSTVTTAQAG